MTDGTDRGLWKLTRLDGAVLVRFGRGGNISPSDIEQAFPGHLLFHFSPGAATVVTHGEEAEAGLAHLPDHRTKIYPGISLICAEGDGMSAADNRARRICARLDEEGIPFHVLSLSDIGAALAVDTDRADRAEELIRTEFLFSR